MVLHWRPPKLHILKPTICHILLFQSTNWALESSLDDDNKVLKILMLAKFL